MKDEHYGRLLVQRYQLLEIAGKGSMGQVYQAKDTLLGGVTVAVKFLLRSRMNQRIRDRFIREATISALLGEQSIHIVKVRDYGVDEDDLPFYVMEYLKGSSLKDVMQNKPMSLPKFFSIMRQMCLGLQCAHDGIEIDGRMTQVIHRDIKPSNIIITKDATLGELVKILDFGIALLKSDSSPTGFMGTPAYCSPEQMEGKALDHRADIYSLGIMMFQMLTGELPFKPNTNSFEGWFQCHHDQKPKLFSEVKAKLDLPQTLMDVVNQCMSKKAHQRPTHIHELLAVLERIDQVSTHFTSTLSYSKDLEKTPLNTKTFLTIEDTCLQSTWPQDKPRAEIVFPQLLHHNNLDMVTIWIMLSQNEIDLYKKIAPYSQFLFVSSPHPMLLWLTTLYQSEQQYRMLPCYLDLKKPTGEKMLRLLTQTNSYQLLLFAIEGGDCCVCTVEAKIPSKKVRLLKEWLAESQNSPAISGQIKVSKQLLKEELESLKPNLLNSLHLQFSKK